MMGCAHAPGNKWRDAYARRSVVAMECETGKPCCYHATRDRVTPGQGAIIPALRDVMYCLILDASVLDYPDYESWCADMGYDTDSRRGEATYRQCIDLALKLRAAIGDDGLTALRNLYEGY